MAATAVALVVAVGWPAGRLLVVHQRLEPLDAIVSLASHEWERLPRAAALAVEHPRALVLLTEPPILTGLNCHDCAHRTAWLVRQGIAAERIHVVPLSLSGTYAEAVASLEFLRPAHVGRLAVVTSPYHTRRALATFETVFAGSGIAIGVEPASASSPARPARWWLAPYDRAYVAYEWAAIVYYAAKYGVWPFRGSG